MPSMTLERAVSIPAREPNGRRSRSLDPIPQGASPGEAKRLRDAALRGMAAPEWGTALGRLFLEDKIEAMHYEAGKKWLRTVEAWHEAIGAPPPRPPAQAFDAGRGKDREPDPDTEAGQRRAEQHRRAIRAMEAAQEALIGAGKLAEAMVKRVVETDADITLPNDLASLRHGLYWLAGHWGLHPTAKNVRRVK